jgi:outer membrane protein assembly factor BamB
VIRGKLVRKPAWTSISHHCFLPVVLAQDSKNRPPPYGVIAVLALLVALPVAAAVDLLVILGSGWRPEPRESHEVAQSTDAEHSAPQAVQAPAAAAVKPGEQKQGQPADQIAPKAADPPPAPGVTTSEPPPAPPARGQSAPAEQKNESLAIGPAIDKRRHPLVEDLSKEAYNVLAELKAAVDGRAWDDAARLVTSLAAEAAVGVAPYPSDEELLASLPVAIQLALKEHAELRQAIRDDFAELAALRINQAIRDGDTATVELATVQFAGCEAVAVAHRWLGDGAMVRGFFAQAIRDYERASLAAPSQADELAPRIRLAAAILGRDTGSFVTKPVTFGDESFAAAELEALIAEMRGRSGARQTGESRTVPPPSAYEAHFRSRLDGPVGDRPQEQVLRHVNQYQVPWTDRQIATVVENDILYVANRFQVAKYDLAEGQRIWQSQSPSAPMQRAQEWTMIPMKPLIHGERIFVRLLYSPNPLLSCFEKATGKLLWTAETKDREFLASDPVLIDGRLVALAISLHPDRHGILQWRAFDQQTGEVLQSRELVKLRNSWAARACCEITAVENGLVAVLGGVTIAVDTRGSIRWIRMHVTSPPDEDPRWVLQMYQPPISRDGRLYVTQPGVRTVNCLDAATGRELWSTVLPDVVGLVGVSRNSLTVRTERGIEALDAVDGGIRWRHAADHLYSFSLIDDERLLLAQRARTPGDMTRWQVRFAWLDAATGKAISSTSLSSLADSEPCLGPLVPFRDRLFVFFGRGQHEPTRDLVELVPNNKVSAPSRREDVANLWPAAAKP